MAKVLTLFKTDFNHSYNSMDLIGVFTNKSQLHIACRKLIKEDIKPLYDSTKEFNRDVNYHLTFLLEKGQTQGLENFELVIEEQEANVIF